MRLPIKAVIGLSALLIIGLIGLLVFVAGQTNSSNQKLVESGEVRASALALPTLLPVRALRERVGGPDVAKPVARRPPYRVYRVYGNTVPNHQNYSGSVF